MEFIENQTYSEERALYNLKDAFVKNCSFAGPEDGESALKESRNINVDHCDFSLRYPIWHAQKYVVKNCTFGEKARAPFWYCLNGTMFNSSIKAVKTLRESTNTHIEKCNIQSDEFGWKCHKITMNNSSLIGEYAFLESKDIDINLLSFKGKYSFQYVENVNIKGSYLDTKDAFWHCKNVTVINSVIKSEYLGWFSEGLTLINCKIIGTQPLCYCKRLRIIDCVMVNCDRAFEYSDVDAKILGSIISVKNPLSGTIYVHDVEEVITDDPAMECHGKVINKRW